jgi:uncharacterized protein YbbK (DUF523 family)
VGHASLDAQCKAQATQFCEEYLKASHSPSCRSTAITTYSGDGGTIEKMTAATLLVDLNRPRRPITFCLPPKSW